MIARRLAVLVALASPPELSAFSRIYGIWPGEDHLQDFWGPARLGFEGSFAYEASVLAASDDDVASIIGGILGASGDARGALVVGPMRHGEASYAAFLEAGGAFFPIAEGVDLAAYGLTNETSFQFVFSPDPINAAGLVAQEICRTTGYGAIHRVMRLYGAAYADSRVDANLAWLEEHCGATIFEHSSLRAYFREETAYDLAFSALVKDSSASLIVAANDRMVKGALRAIEDTLSPAAAAKILIAGFDWTEDWMLKQGKIVADGDQYMSTPGMGAWLSMQNVIDVVRANDYNTTADLQRFFDDDAAQLETETSCQYADAEGYVVSDLLGGTYAADVRAKPESGVGPTVVRVGARDVGIEDVDTAGGSFAATVWIRLEWRDPRLAFDVNIYNGTLYVDTDRIWSPDIYVDNLITPVSLVSIKVLPASILPDGTVRATFKAVGDFICDMNIAPYPYDEHECAFEVTTATTVDQVELVGDLGYNIFDGPEGYLDPEEEAVVDYTDSSTGSTFGRVDFTIKFTRNPAYVVSTYVLVGWALNMLGFLVFWVPTEGSGIDRSGLAMTTILTAQFMMYDAKITKETTWLDFYFSSMITFQLVAFVLTVHSSRMNRMALALGGDETYLDKVYRRQNELGAGSGRPFKNVVFFLFNLIYGGRDAFSVDRWARRYFVPFFFAFQIFLSFYPWWGDGDISGSPYTGFNSELCRLNIFFAGCYLIVLVLGLACRSWDDKPEGVSANWRLSLRTPLSRDSEQYEASQMLAAEEVAMTEASEASELETPRDRKARRRSKRSKSDKKIRDAAVVAPPPAPPPRNDVSLSMFGCGACVASPAEDRFDDLHAAHDARDTPMSL